MATRRSKTIGVGSAGSRAQPYHSKPRSGGGLSLMLDKKLGQHLLKNPGVLDKIIQAAEIKSTDTVLEIGPGTGNLTMRILPIARKVIALDIDERMVGEVRKRAMSSGYTNLEVRHGDALRSDLGKFEICTANLPYQISSPFVFKLLAHRPMFRNAVLMFQKEFAERLLAQPGDKSFCRLSVNTQIFCRVDRVCLVKAGSFSPPPKVDSMIVKLTPRKPQLQIDFREWDGLMRICFMRKRKTLHSVFTIKSVLQMLEFNYKTWCTLTKHAPVVTDMKEIVKSILDKTQLSQSRAVSISIEQYFQLLLAFNKKNIHFRNISSGPDSIKDNCENVEMVNPFQGMEKDFFLSMQHIDAGDEPMDALVDDNNLVE